jgi:thiol-disulfide isomerase/thioredoxin
MFKQSILFTLLAFMLTFQACSKEKTDNVNDMISTQEYILTGLDKKQYKVTKEANGFLLENAKGKVLIFDIFATWCPPCRASASHISSLQKKYKDDVIVIGLNIEDNIPNAKLEDFRETYGADYTLVNSPRNRPLADEIVNELGLGDRYPIPIMAIYKDGKLITHYVGLIQEEFVESDIKRALGK